MKLKQHRKHRKFVSSAVSLLLIFTMILSFPYMYLLKRLILQARFRQRLKKTHYRKTENTYLLKKKK